MNKINFNNITLFNKYFKKKITNTCLEHSNASICYLGKDGLVYKKLFNNNKNNKPYNYDINKIITIEDTKVESYNFPITLFCVKNNVVGYTSKLIKKDYLLNNLIKNGFYYKILGIHDITYTKNAVQDIIINNLKEIDYKKLKKAYEKLYIDTISISNKGIRIQGLNNNLIFDGEKLIATNTINYKKENNNTSIDNIITIEMVLKNELEYLYNYVTNDYINRDEKMYSYINKIKERVNEEFLYDKEINKYNKIKKLTLEK